MTGGSKQVTREEAPTERIRNTDKGRREQAHPALHSYGPIFSFFRNLSSSCSAALPRPHSGWHVHIHIHHTWRCPSTQFPLPPVYPNLYPTTPPSQMSTRRDGWCSRSNSASKKAICVVLFDTCVVVVVSMCVVCVCDGVHMCVGCVCQWRCFVLNGGRTHSLNQRLDRHGRVGRRTDPPPCA